jgi:metal-responsive CopG/Arc/MetJ family transcriptional regulator
MNRRMNISLPVETLRLLERAVEKGHRSRLIDLAIRRYLSSAGRASLRKQLAAGYRRSADRSLSIAAEWFPLEEEGWQKTGR